MLRLSDRDGVHNPTKIGRDLLPADASSQKRIVLHQEKLRLADLSEVFVGASSAHCTLRSTDLVDHRPVLTTKTYTLSIFRLS